MAMTIRVGSTTYNLDHIRKIEHRDDLFDAQTGATITIIWANGDVELIEGVDAIAFDAQLMIFQMHVDAAVGAEFAREVKLANHEAKEKQYDGWAAARKKKGFLT